MDKWINGQMDVLQWISSQIPRPIFKLSLTMLINRSDEDHHDARKQSLIQQILSYTTRIQQYQGLENQLNNISSFIDKQQFSSSHTSTPTLSKNFSRKSLDHLQKRTLQLKKDPNQRRISSSKKIKLYELQKKLARLSKDHNQKFSALVSQKRQHQVTLQTINQLSTLTKKQNLKLIQLQNEHSRLVEESIAKNTEYVKAKKELEEICDKKESYQFEKHSLLDKIVSQKKNIQNLKNQISLVQSQIFSNSINKSNKVKNNAKSNQEIQIKLSKNGQSVKQLEEDIANQVNSYSLIQWNSKKGSNNQMTNVQVGGVVYNIVDSNNSFESLETNEKLNYHQEQNIFSVLKDKVQIVQSQNCELNEQILKVKKEMVSIETEIKHHKTSLQLLKHKIKMKNLFIERQKTTHIKNLSPIESIRRMLSEKEGERGEMRGKIGTRVDQQGILKLINTTLEKDLNNLKQKTDCLIVLRNMLCGQIIQFK